MKRIRGLKINFSKSKIGGIGVGSSLIQNYASILNCDSMSLPFVYLGILIGASLRRENMWGPILEKCRIRLSKWKQKTLSSVGRVILINLVLFSLPLFSLSF